MENNQVPTAERLRYRIKALEIREGSIWVKSGRGNPYYHCSSCGIHTPEYTNNGYRHRQGCHHQGLAKELAYYKGLLKTT